MFCVIVSAEGTARRHIVVLYWYICIMWTRTERRQRIRNVRTTVRFVIKISRPALRIYYCRDEQIIASRIHCYSPALVHVLCNFSQYLNLVSRWYFIVVSLLWRVAIVVAENTLWHGHCDILFYLCADATVYVLLYGQSFAEYRGCE